MRFAKLRIRTGTTPWPQASIYRLATTTWNESTITWNNAPLDPLVYYQLPGVPANTWVELDVAPIVTRDLHHRPRSLRTCRAAGCSAGNPSTRRS